MINNLFVRKLLKPVKPIAKKIFPSYFKYNTLNYWKYKEGPVYFDYWDKKHGDEKKSRIQESTISKEIKELNIRNILEYGCGYGRILKVITKIQTEIKPEYYGCDISEHQLKNAKSFLGNSDKVTLFLVNGKEIQYSDKYFELVYTVDVLLHQTYDLIDEVRKELLRVSSKYIMHLEPNYSNEQVKNDKNDKILEKTCYKHNHIDFYLNNNCKLVNQYVVEGLGNTFMLFQKND